jgi:WhiB family redox-sensing transcriptional regulator
MNITFIDEDHVRINGMMVNVIESLGKAGACREEDPDLFFPENTEESSAFETTKKAKAICRACPVVDLCLEYALNSDVIGIWGATNDTDRKQIRIDRIRRKDAERRREYVARKNMEQYGTAKAPRSAESLKKFQQAGAKANTAKSEEANLRILALLSSAFSQIEGNENPEVVSTAKYRLEHPTLSLQEMADAMGVSRNVVGGRLRRLMERYGGK